MIKNFLIWACAIFSVVFLLAAAASQLYAIDSSNRYFAYGLGQKTCEDYVKFREKKLETLERQYERLTKEDLYEIVNKVVDQWIAGFVTAHDFYVSDTYDLLGKTTMDDVKDRLETTCRANPQEYFAQAMVSVVQKLNPQRVKVEPRK